MMPLAMLSWIELLVLFFAGTLVLKVTGCGRRCAPGFLLKAVGVVAVVAGIGLLLSRSGRMEDRPHEVTLRDEIIRDIEFHDGFESGDFVRPFHARDERHASRVHVAPSRAMFIVLGSGLIILGAMLFGRERTRPFALKAITWLGVAAILFAVVNFFGDPPRAERSARLAAHRTARSAVEHAVRVPRDVAESQRARRPSLRPKRPAHSDTEYETLPPRAGEIPVELNESVVEASVSVEPKVNVEVAAPEDVTIEGAESIAATAETDAAPVESPATATAPEMPAKPDLPAKPQPVAAVASSVVAASDESAASESAPTPARPAWVDAAPGLKNGVYSLTVNSGPYVSVPECQRALDAIMQAATNHYIEEYLGDEQAAKLVDLPLAYVKQNLKRAEYSEIIQSQSVGPMYQLHARLDFDDRARADFQRLWRNALVEDRLWYTGGGAALILALLATFYGYMRLDLKTDASHRGRLQLAATLVALIVAGGALLARWAVAF